MEEAPENGKESPHSVHANGLIDLHRQSLPVKLTLDQKQLENVESFKYLGRMLTNDGRCNCGIKYRIAMA